MAIRRMASRTIPQRLARVPTAHRGHAPLPSDCQNSSADRRNPRPTRRTLPARNALHRGRVAGGRLRRWANGQTAGLNSKETGRAMADIERIERGGHPAARMARARALRARRLRGRAGREPRARARGLHRDHAGAGGRDARTLRRAVPRGCRRRQGRHAARVHRRAHGRHRHDRARHGRAALREPDRRMARRRVHVPAARESGGRPPANEDRRAPDRGHRSRNAAKRDAPTTTRSTRAAKRRSSSRSGRTCSRRASPTSGRTTRSPSPSSISRPCATTRARSACASRLRSRRVTSRARRRRRQSGHGHRRRRRSHHAAGCRIAREGYVLPVTIAIDLDPGFAAVAPREHVPLDGDRRQARSPLSHYARRRPGARGARLRAHVDAGCRRRAGRRALHRNQGEQDVCAPDGAAAHGCQGRHRPTAARDHLHHRHLGLDGRRVDDAGARGAAAGARPPAARRPLQRHRVQLGHDARSSQRRCRSMRPR